MMVRDATGLREVKGAHVRHGGVLAEIGEIIRRDASGLASVWRKAAPLAVSVMPSFTTGARAGAGALTVQVERVTATPTGGVPPYAYAWSRIDSGPASWAIGSGDTASPVLSATAVPTDTTVAASFRCVVTDARGTIATSANVDAEATNYGGGLYA